MIIIVDVSLVRPVFGSFELISLVFEQIDILEFHHSVVKLRLTFNTLSVSHETFNHLVVALSFWDFSCSGI
jgi:hypothetical protein